MIVDLDKRVFYIPSTISRTSCLFRPLGVWLFASSILDAYLPSGAESFLTARLSSFRVL